MKKNDLCGRIFPKFAFLIVSQRYRNRRGGSRPRVCAHKTTISRRLPFGRPHRARVVLNTVTRSVRSRINRLIGLREHNKKTISPRCVVAGARTREKKNISTLRACQRVRTGVSDDGGNRGIGKNGITVFTVTLPMKHGMFN